MQHLRTYIFLVMKDPGEISSEENNSTVTNLTEFELILIFDTHKEQDTTSRNHKMVSR